MERVVVVVGSTYLLPRKKQKTCIRFFKNSKRNNYETSWTLYSRNRRAFGSWFQLSCENYWNQPMYVIPKFRIQPLTVTVEDESESDESMKEEEDYEIQNFPEYMTK